MKNLTFIFLRIHKNQASHSTWTPHSPYHKRISGEQKFKNGTMGAESSHAMSRLLKGSQKQSTHHLSDGRRLRTVSLHRVLKCNWFCEWTKINIQFFSSPPNSEKERKGGTEMGPFVTPPHLISQRKETPRGFGENHFKAFSKKAVYVPRGSVFSLTLPLALPLTSLWTTLSLPGTFIYKTTSRIDCAHGEQSTRDKNVRHSCQQGNVLN